MIEQCISPYRAAKLLGCSYENIRMKCVRGEIEGAVKFGDRWMIPVNSPSLPGNMPSAHPKPAALPDIAKITDIDARVARMKEKVRQRKRLMKENPGIRFHIKGGAVVPQETKSAKRRPVTR